MGVVADLACACLEQGVAQEHLRLDRHENHPRVEPSCLARRRKRALDGQAQRLGQRIRHPRVEAGRHWCAR